MKPVDRLLSTPRGEQDSAEAYATAHAAFHPDDVTAYLNAVFSTAPKVGLDPSIAVAQSAHETGAWTSAWWVTRLNPAGLGITGDPAENLASHAWANGNDAALSHLGHMLVYALGPAAASHVWASAGLGSLASIDPRYVAYVEAHGNSATAVTIHGLAGTWGTDPAYDAGVCDRGNAIYPKLPNQGETPPVADALNMTPGLIPMPSTIQDIIDVGERDQSLSCRGYDNLGARRLPPHFLVLHRSINGAGQSNSGYFHESCCPALTDLEVIATTGQGRRFVALPGDVSGWANGVVKAPYGDALAWLNLHNWELDTVNRDGESCEITGNYEDAVSDKAWAWLAQWIASRAHDYGITHETFPLIPAEADRSYITWHQEWTAGTGKICPGPVVMNYTPTLIERARATMKAAQTTGKPPVNPPTKKPYASPVKEVLDHITADIKRGHPTDFVWKGLTLYGAIRTYEAIKATRRLQYPDPKAPSVGPSIAVRTKFVAHYWTVAVDDKGTKRAFMLTPYGTWVAASALSPRVSIRKA